MGRVRRARMGAGEEAEVWRRWKRGESSVVIGRALDRDKGAVYTVVARRGGIPPPARTRARRVLRAPEREEISRGLARGESLRQISRRLGRLHWRAMKMQQEYQCESCGGNKGVLWHSGSTCRI